MNALRTGMIRNKAKGKKENYYISKLDLSHLNKLIKFDKIVIQSIEREDLYVGLDIKEYENILRSDSGVIIGVFVEEEIVGFCSILFPGDSYDNLGKDIGISEKNIIDVAHLEGAGVHPNFRGNSIQKTMTEVCLEQAMKLKNIKHLCATVSPYNYPSINDVFTFGLYIRDFKIKYGSKLRYICSKNMEDKEEIITDSIEYVDSNDHITQLKLLNNSYVGFGLEKDVSENFISFGKIKIN